MPERSGWDGMGWGGGGVVGCWAQEHRPSPYGACREREKGSKIERDKQTLRPKQIGHLCLKYKNKYIIENN